MLQSIKLEAVQWILLYIYIYISYMIYINIWYIVHSKMLEVCKVLLQNTYINTQWRIHVMYYQKQKKIVNDLANQKNITMILRPSMEISPQFHTLYKALETA